MRCFALLTLATLALLPGVALAIPVVTETDPPDGAREVAPSVNELRVRFDQPMETSSWSWCGGGPRFPQLAGDPYWADGQTAVLPVRLAPQKTYFLSIGCTSSQGFRSVSGEVARVQPYSFTTGGEAVGRTDMAVVEAAQRAILERYAHRDRTGADWNLVFGEAGGWLASAPDADEFACRLARILGPAEDPHLVVRSPGGTTWPTTQRSVRVNADYDFLRSRVSVEQPHPAVWYFSREGVGYLGIHTWQTSTGFEEALHGALDALADTRSLVIDVRSNGGGDELAARRFAGRFTDRAVAYSQHRSITADGAIGPMQQRVLEPNTGRIPYTGRVVLLQGPVCMSSNESFIKMMTEACGAVTVGATTAGSSGNPQPYELPNGVVLVMPSWQDFDMAGHPLEGHGIVPAVPVDFVPGGGDAVLEAGFEVARQAADDSVPD